MKNKVLAIILILSLGLNIGILARFSYHWLNRKGYRERPRESSWMRKKMQKELCLSEAQVCFMEQNRKNIDQELKSIKQELKRKRVELFTALDTEPVDQAKINKLIDTISVLQAKIEKTVVGHLVTMKKNLTPEQRQKFREIMPKGFVEPMPDQPGMGRPERPPDQMRP